MFFNFHTHNKRVKNSIFNVRLGHDEIRHMNSNFSVGVHPWDVHRIDLNTIASWLENELKKPNCIALGEIGLDKICGTNLELQKVMMQRQLNFAKKHQKKVLIIHCVKAYQEIIQIKKANDTSFVWVLHGFNGGKELIKQMLDHGFFFSLGSAVLNPQSKISKSLLDIPLDSLFLETDESTIDIEELYGAVSKLFEMSKLNLAYQIHKNLNSIFGKSLKIKNEYK